MEKKGLDNIELRSEKVRNVIGKVPPRLSFLLHDVSPQEPVELQGTIVGL